jgi:hypothetical protein
LGHCFLQHQLALCGVTGSAALELDSCAASLATTSISLKFSSNLNYNPSLLYVSFILTMSGLRLLRRDKDGNLHFQEFIGGNVPPYAVLSHRWIDGEEVTFDEMQDGSATHKAGYLKVKRFAEEAFFDGFEYCWADTCC